jgi:putative AlgH/UPF0301 family transcriptional regulator
MENPETLLVVGALITLTVQVVRHFVELDRKQVSLLVLLASVGAVGGLELASNGWVLSDALQNFLAVLGASQLVYEVVLKRLGVESLLEAK